MMIYRELGNTSLKVSQLGFGAMRLPTLSEGESLQVDRDKATPMIRKAIDSGVNYVDSAVFYCNQDSQCAVGDALRDGYRDKVILSTKNHYYGDDEKEWWTHLENSLERLQTDRIDVYNHHGINRDKFTNAVKPRISKWMKKAQDQGLIKHICCSFHDNNEFLMELIDSGYPEIITLQYNLLDRKLEEGIARAHEKGIGIVVMGPVGGGRLGAPSDVLSKLLPDVARVPELALRFVLSNPNISTALSGMSTMEQVEENIRVCSIEDPLNDHEMQLIEDHMKRLKEMSDLYCSGCNYCMPCPSEVNISGVFQNYNLGRVYGLWDAAKQRYQNMKNNKRDASQCIDCGACEPQCPQNINIRAELKRAADALDG